MFSSFGRACLFLYTVAFQRRRSTSAAQKEPKRAPQKSSRHEQAWLRANKNHASTMQITRACMVLVRTQPGSRVPCSSCAPTKCVLPLTTYQVGGPSRCAPRVFPGTWKIFQFCFLLVGSAPEGREFTIFVLLALPQREETLQLRFYCLCPEIRDFTIMFYYCLCPKGKRLYNFVVLALTQRVETLQFCSLALPREKRLHNFVLLNLPRENRNFTILFFFWICPERRDFTVLIYWVCPRDFALVKYLGNCFLA